MITVCLGCTCQPDTSINYPKANSTKVPSVQLQQLAKLTEVPQELVETIIYQVITSDRVAVHEVLFYVWLLRVCIRVHFCTACVARFEQMPAKFREGVKKQDVHFLCTWDTRTTIANRTQKV